MKKIKFGIMGCASIAKRSMAEAMIDTGAIEIVAVASRDFSKACEFAKTFNCTPIEGYHNLLERNDIDAIYIPLPTGLHHEWIINSLKKGKHVLSEKSLAHSYAATKEIVELARKNNLILDENFMFLFHRQLKIVTDLVNENKIGHVHLLRSSFGFSTLLPGDIRFNKSLGGGALLDVGTYTLKSAQHFLGQDLTVMSSLLNKNLDYDVDTVGSVMLKNKLGQVAQLSFGFNHHYQCQLELWGSLGKITMERVFTAPPTFFPKIKIETKDGVEIIEAPSDNHFKNLLLKFVEDVNSKNYVDNGVHLLNQSRLLNDVMMQNSL